MSRERTDRTLEEASIHKSAKSAKDSRNLDLWPFNRNINGFPGLIVKHFYVKFRDPRSLVSCGKTDRHTDKRR